MNILQAIFKSRFFVKFSPRILNLRKLKCLDTPKTLSSIYLLIHVVSFIYNKPVYIDAENKQMDSKWWRHV